MMTKENRLVVGNASWADTIPQWLLDEVKAERMVLGLASIVKLITKVGDAEVLVFLMTSSLRAPLNHNYAEIYIYLTSKVMRKRGVELEDFMEEKLEQGLTPDQERELKKLRDMIYDKRGGEISHPILNIMRNFGKEVDL